MNKVKMVSGIVCLGLLLVVSNSALGVIGPYTYGMDGIKDAFRTAINWVIEKWNNLSLKLGGATISLPFGKSFTVPSVTLRTPNIPLLQGGGIVTSPTLAILGEAGPEAVVPLNSRGGFGGGNLTVVVEGSLFGAASVEDLVDIIEAARRDRSLRGGALVG